MPRDNQSFDEALGDIANRKQQTAHARFGNVRSVGEPPKEVFFEATMKIASAFESKGYRFLKSGPQMSRKAGDFIFRVVFQTSHNNVAGQFVSMSILANVLSPTLKKWRSTRHSLCKESDFVAGGQIGNLIKNHSWMEWNLADPSTRDDDVKDAIAKIREIAFPYFSAFADCVGIGAKILHDEIAEIIHLGNLIDYLMCFAPEGVGDDCGASSFRPQSCNS